MWVNEEGIAETHDMPSQLKILAILSNEELLFRWNIGVEPNCK